VSKGAGGNLLLVNGVVRTLDPNLPQAEAVLVLGNRVRAVGSGNELRPVAPPGVEVLDLRGRAVLPAFTDAHVHFLEFATGLKPWSASRRPHETYLQANGSSGRGGTATSGPTPVSPAGPTWTGWSPRTRWPSTARTSTASG